VSLGIRWPDALRRDAAPTVPDYGLIHEGATWRVHFLGDSFTILDKTGVMYLARLLHDPSNAWTALEVQRGYRTEAPRQAEAQPEDGTELSDQMENLLHASNGQGAARLRRLLTPLRRQLAEAERTGDVIGEREARAELAKLLPGANQVIGRDARSRVSGAAEKARKNVSKQINQALAAIEREREPVARHIRDHLTLGLSMTYSPTRGEAWHVVFPKI
jgi:predicted component of type VI protein secretion system